ncbi:hypothetical protein ACQCVP_07435 [Rossellomorea vietnamensis]|uniref:hypothetical protein n=1 Tax=Rossellomorea vietnamensis TaxID=218284 RepID=UPI003CF24A69
MFRREKKAVFPFILSGLFDPEGLGAVTRRHQKWKRLGQPRQANVPEKKKAVFPFILSGLFDPEGLGAVTRRPLVPQEIARLQRRSFYVKGGRGKNSIQKQQSF